MERTNILITAQLLSILSVVYLHTHAAGTLCIDLTGRRFNFLFLQLFSRDSDLANNIGIIWLFFGTFCHYLAGLSYNPLILTICCVVYTFVFNIGGIKRLFTGPKEIFHFYNIMLFIHDMKYGIEMIDNLCMVILTMIYCCVICVQLGEGEKCMMICFILVVIGALSWVESIYFIVNRIVNLMSCVSIYYYIKYNF